MSKTIFGLFVALLFALLAAPLRAQDKQPCYAVILGDGVRLREKPSTKSKVVAQQNRGALCQVVQESSKYDYANPDAVSDPMPCELHQWLRVKTRDGKTGWVYGQFAAVSYLGANTVPSASGETFSLDGQRYYLQLGRKPNYHSEDASCMGQFYPFLMTAAQDKAFLLKPTSASDASAAMLGVEDSPHQSWFLKYTENAQQDVEIAEIGAKRLRLLVSTQSPSGEALQEVSVSIARDAKGGFSMTVLE